MSTATTPQQTEIQALREAVKGISGHPFVPKPAVEAITQACSILESLAQRVAALEAAAAEPPAPGAFARAAASITGLVR